MLLRLLYDPRLAQASWLVGCQATGEALVLDPNRDVRAYVEAARAAGAGGGRIVARHLAPQVSRLVLESADLRFASAILSAASLDYLGIGLSADRPTWGRMILDGQAYLREAPWIALPAVGLLCLTTVGLVLAGARASRTAG